MEIKITNNQLFSLTVSTSIGGSILVVSSVLSIIAKQDAWIVGLVTPLIGVFIVLLYCYLGSKFPNMTIVEIIKKILGKWIGSIVAASLVFLSFILCINLPWYVSNFLTTHAIPETPPYAINFLFVVAVVIAVIYGLEAIARVSELIFYFSSVLFIITILLLIPNIKIENIQPVLEHGIRPVLEGSIFLSAFITFPLINILMVFPKNIYDIKKARAAIIKGYLCSSFFVFIFLIVTILVLGFAITASSQYPTYLLGKEIKIGRVLTRLEFVVAIVWFATQFIINVFFYYSTLIGLSQLIGLKDYKKIAIPLGFIIFIMTGVIFPNVIYQGFWASIVWTPYIVTHGLILPLVLLIVYLIRKHIFKNV
ncbi:UNVERIFIED_CONTAM: spore germination protein KB [Acetivibrio alkalicellulosi]